MTKTSSKSVTTKSAKKSSGSSSFNGTSTQSSNGKGSGPSNAESLRKLYAALLRQRLVQEHFQKTAPDQYRLAIGHEAVTVGVTADLRAEDTIAASRSNQAARVARGASAGSQLKGDEAECSLGTLTPASLPQDPFNLGTGLALTHKFEKKQNVVVAFCDEQSPQLNTWREAFHGAGVLKLPLIYVIVNADQNQAGSDDKLEDFSFYMKEYGFPGIMVDACDVVAVWRVGQESIHRARNGSGPTLIDCRMLSQQDPLAHMEHYMRKRAVWDDAWKKQQTARIRSEIKAAR